MISIQVHFDGRVIVPDEPVDLPQDKSYLVLIETSVDNHAGASALAWLAEQEVDDDLPTDLSLQHDHYLYGVRKRE